MKCGICKTEMKKELIEHKEFGISLGRFPAMVCRKCGEKFYDSATVDKIQESSKKTGLFGLVSRVKAAKIGNSLAIRVPKEIADFVHLKQGAEIILYPEGKKIIAEIA